ncbi:hypothetical protein N431DRAFT_465048 [Stipitochalara longipes BDJ]|nr:hypothetical protein N431DRAFT_465048 [Stipitochalara longipes BDJ]
MEYEYLWRHVFSSYAKFLFPSLVYKCQPSLYFGTSLMEALTGFPPSYTKPAYPTEDFEDFLTSYEDELEVTALRRRGPSAPLVLTWPALKSDRDALIRVQNRRLAIIEAKEGLGQTRSCIRLGLRVTFKNNRFGGIKLGFKFGFKGTETSLVISGEDEWEGLNKGRIPKSGKPRNSSSGTVRTV